MQGLFEKYFIGIYPDGIADIVSAFPRRKKTPQSFERGVGGDAMSVNACRLK
jgi:hypothetical protein